MNKEQTSEAITVMQAYVDGAEIEIGPEWATVKEPTWTWTYSEYRIKPGPREFWIDPKKGVVSIGKPMDMVLEQFIKVREVIE